MAGRKMAELVLSEAERAELKLLSARRKTSQALALRARIVRECARGVENREVAARLRVADGTATGAAASWRCLSKSWSAIEYGSDVGRSDQIREVADLLLETGLLATLFVKSGTANDVRSLASAVAEEAVHNGQDNAVSAAPRYQVARVFRNRLIDRQDLLGEACPQIVGSQRASAARRPSSIKAMPRRSSAIEPTLMNTRPRRRHQASRVPSGLAPVAAPSMISMARPRLRIWRPSPTGNSFGSMQRICNASPAKALTLPS
jgi:hypothetical protein